MTRGRPAVGVLRREGGDGSIVGGGTDLTEEYVVAYPPVRGPVGEASREISADLRRTSSLIGAATASPAAPTHHWRASIRSAVSATDHPAR